ncbi:ribonuclease H-like domain-containing protein [Tanacetum coccineum]|uniref:Ribonuclease H-like domain-containing protein n=1 Tax=Tanacetum coccineum TaxID=301880 RepID=A0ABQ4XCI8_9ASTR
MTTVRCLINIDVQKDWPLYQLDVNNAFLYSDLYEDVYMTLPPGFSSNNDKVVCSGDTFVALLVYVDDIVITGSDIKQIDDFKQYLKILHEFGLLAAKPVLCPLPTNFVLNHIESNEDKALTNVSNYQKLIGKLIYLTHTTPDISYYVHCLSQHIHSPLASHLKIALRVLRYLKSSPGCGVQVVATSKKGRVLGAGSTTDPAFVLTGTLGSGSIHATRTSSPYEDIRILKKQNDDPKKMMEDEREATEAQKAADLLAWHKTLNDRLESFAQNYPPRTVESDHGPS